VGLPSGFQKPVLLFKTGTVAQKMTFVFLDLETKNKKPDPVYRPGSDRKREKNPETGGSRPVFETLVAVAQTGISISTCYC
jgi:hypothetical protein